MLSDDMTSEQEPDAGLIQHIVQVHTGGRAGLPVDCSPGFSGSFVYAVDVALPDGPKDCIVKFVPDWPDAEDVTNRVYGSRAASYRAAYDLLRQHGVLLPHLYAALAPQPGLPFYCFVMERLAGEEVQTVRSHLGGAERRQLDALIGRHLGAIHRITRAYDGWADLPAPHAVPWRAAFFAALSTILDRACVHSSIVQRRPQLVRTFAQYAAAWVDPVHFVLSHGDGLQGMLVRGSDGWGLAGVIDIEDHLFTDQRFALSVYEMGLGDAPVSDIFWVAYRQQASLDETYWQFRPLFQLYALLDWLGNVALADAEDVEHLTQEIDQRCR
jgi:aminoglycoside phosphotransferase (APT) family kinase protein